MVPIISVENLSKEYTTYKRGESFGSTLKSLFFREKIIVQAVNSISFDIQPGEIVGLLGENGAGKSTTIKMLTGVLFPTAGQVSVLDYKPYTQRKKYVQHIGAVFGQKSQLIWDIPPLDSFALNKAIYCIPEDFYRQRLDAMLDLLHIREIVEKPTRVLSLGERMKCEFVMAMLHDPKVVFLDEPTIGVDIVAKEAIRSFIRSMNEQGVTFILTTHDLEDVERLAHRVIVISSGKIVFDDSLAELRHYLGEKKTVHIVTKGTLPPLGDLLGDGVSLVETSGDKEAVLEVDNAILPMDVFIGRLASFGELQDLAIKEMAIEEIIKAIYIRGGAK